MAILLDPLQYQIRILQYYRQYIEKTSLGEVATLDMYDKAIQDRKVHLRSFQRLLKQGNNTQNLVKKWQGWRFR